MWNCRVQLGGQRRQHLARHGVHSKFWLRWRLGKLAGSVPCHLVGRIAKERTVRRVGRWEISHNGDMATTSAASREEDVRRGRQLEYFTIGYNSLEGVASIVA